MLTYCRIHIVFIIFIAVCSMLFTLCSFSLYLLFLLPFTDIFCSSRLVRNNSRPIQYRDNTGVDVICFYRNDSTMPVLDRVKLYHELVNRTKGFTEIPPYHLDRYSLFINGTQVVLNVDPLSVYVLQTSFPYFN